VQVGAMPRAMNQSRWFLGIGSRELPISGQNNVRGTNSSDAQAKNNGEHRQLRVICLNWILYRTPFTNSAAPAPGLR